MSAPVPEGAGTVDRLLQSATDEGDTGLLVGVRTLDGDGVRNAPKIRWRPLLRCTPKHGWQQQEALANSLMTLQVSFEMLAGSLKPDEEQRKKQPRVFQNGRKTMVHDQEEQLFLASEVEIDGSLADPGVARPTRSLVSPQIARTRVLT